MGEERASGAPRARPSPSSPGQCRTGVLLEEGAGREPILSRTEETLVWKQVVFVAGTPDSLSLGGDY